MHNMHNMRMRMHSARTGCSCVRQASGSIASETRETEAEKAGWVRKAAEVDEAIRELMRLRKWLKNNVQKANPPPDPPRPPPGSGGPGGGGPPPPPPAPGAPGAAGPSNPVVWV